MFLTEMLVAYQQPRPEGTKPKEGDVFFNPVSTSSDFYCPYVILLQAEPGRLAVFGIELTDNGTWIMHTNREVGVVEEGNPLPGHYKFVGNVSRVELAS